ncbi:MAG: PAS domain S-box protein [Thermodesulfobacteriota bacterium]
MKDDGKTDAGEGRRAPLRHELLETVFASALDGIFVIDRKSRYVDVNPVGCAMFGYTREEFLSSDISLLLFPEDVEGSLANLDKIFKGEMAGYRREIRLRRKDGSDFWVEITVSPFTIDGNDYALGMVRDITAQRRLSEDLIEARERLEAQVAERTRELQEANEALRTIVEGTSSVTGAEFLRSLAKHLAAALKFRYALVGELAPGSKETIRIHALWAGEGFGENFEYDIEGTPCGNVVGKEVCVYPEKVADLFPQDVMLKEMGIESYIGVPIFSSSGPALGVLVAMDDKPMGDQTHARNILSIFALRAALELERKRAEKELGRSREMLREIIDNSTAVIYLKDGQGRYMLVNRRYEEIFHFERKELFGKTDYDIFPGEAADALAVNDRKVLASGAPIEFEETVVHPDGTLHTYISQKFPIPGMPGAVCGMSTDITERNKTFERLKEAQHIASIGSWEWDAATDKALWSEEMYVIFGKEHGADTSYDAFLSSVHPDDREGVDRAIKDAIECGDVYDIEFRIIRPDGTERVVCDKAEVICGEDGRTVRMAGTVQDVTERKRMEAELLRAQKLESIGVLAGGLAHDFNNLLLGILGNVSIARSLIPSGEKAASILDEVEAAALRSKELTKKLLTFSVGGGPLMESASIGRLVRDSASLLLRETNIELDFSLPGDLPLVEMDEGQMAQVINNIVHNARQAMPDGGVLAFTGEKVAVSARDGLPLKEGQYVRITVRDHGVGMPPKVLARIFDPFFTTRQKASGLGLALSYSIVKKHGGFISAESRPGEGTSVHVYLPVSSRQPAPGAASSPRGLSEVVAGKGRVLVMDDEEMVRDVSKEMLNLLGYETECARDGAEAIELFRKAGREGRPFDAVILDLTVPEGMGGLETIKRLIEIDPGVKAIVSSGYSRDPIMSEYGKYGFVSVMAKPYRVSEFSQKVKDVMEQREKQEKPD